MPLSTLTAHVTMLTQHSSFMFAVFDLQLNIHMVNNQFSTVLGKSAPLLISQPLAEVLSPPLFQYMSPYFTRAEKGETVYGEVMSSGDNTPYSYHFCITPIISADQQIQGYLLQGSDITERHRLLDTLQETQRYCHHLTAMLDDGICILEEGIVVSANESAATILGVANAAALLAHPLHDFLRDPHSGNIPEDLHTRFQHCQTLALNSAPRIGSRRRLSLQAANIMQMGNPAQLVMLRTETRVKDEQQQRDPLTGLLNRHSTLRHLQNLIRHNTPLSMLYLDLDNFKNINDSLGHHIGDKVLIEIAGRLRSQLPENAVLGYFGGDEFGIILPNTTKESAKQYGNSLIRAIQHPLDLQQMRKQLSCSIGCVSFPADGSEAHHLLQHADTAMYDAKAQGRNRLASYQPQMNREARLRLWLEVELQKALTRSELDIYFQPKVNTRDFRIIGMEALVRWKHHSEGFISPARFIPVAEKGGLIDWLGRVVMEKVFATLQRWLAQGLNPGLVSINLSPQQFANPGLFNEVLTLQQRYQIPPQRIILEITENAVMTDQEHAAKLLNDFRQHGFVLSIDDFGTGYSSLSYLANFPFDELKIDRGFIHDILHNPKQLAIVESIINLGKSLNMHVIMEGVETHEEATLIAGLNCDGIQGYHFFKPMPESQIEQLLQPTLTLLSAC
ncbi:sensor domain-containing protein [Plesiomonas sp.]|uniref:sensor domain-containing protein n=1 Tax=Plesiomonas sp. TaxID=2486279 RepID=UPI003F2D106F